MSEFLDVPGASGASYRFRRAEPHALPATGGNLMVIKPLKAGPAYIYCAAARSLAQAKRAVDDQFAAHRGAALYVRLNVARSVREAEHEDIVAATRPPVHALEVG